MILIRIKFTFALSSLETGGSILADEVGLGKTIEAGLVIKYLHQSGHNKILFIMPSNLRKQCQGELEERFDISSLIVDSANWDDYLIEIKKKQSIIIVSYHFASKRKEQFGKVAWDFCVFDEAFRESKIKSYQDLNSENVVGNLFVEYQKAFVKKATTSMKKDDNIEQMSIFDFFGEQSDSNSNENNDVSEQRLEDAISSANVTIIAQQVENTIQIDVEKSSNGKNLLPYAKQEFIKKIEELKRVAISVPKIGISYSSTIQFKPFIVKRNIQDFDIAASKIERYDTINEKLLQVLDADALIVENPENMLAVSLLERIPEFSSDDAEFILDVVNQYLSLIEGSVEDKKKIVRRYATIIVNDLRKQIYASKEENTEFVFNVQKNLIVFGPFVKNMKANGRLNFKKEVPDKKNIRHYLFEGFKKSYYAENAFDSDDERRFSVVLEEDNEVIRFIKPPLNQLGLFYRAAKQYNPDFLVETTDKKYMIEIKAANQTDAGEVQEKAKAGLKWCECASKVDADGKIWEYRLIPGDKIVVGNTFKYVIGLAIPISVEE